MPYEYVEFNITPPIRQRIGEVPEDIKLIRENDAIIGLQVAIGSARTTKIKNSDIFKRTLAESEKRLGIDGSNGNKKSKNFINQLEEHIRKDATQRGKNFINQLNYELDSATYDIELTTLAILVLQRQISIGVKGYVKSDLEIDIIQIDDKNNLQNRMINNYDNGLKAQKYGDIVNAYKCFYLVFPDKSNITDNADLNIDLRLLRDGASHVVLDRNKKLVERAKEFLGNEFVKTEGSNTYAYIDMTNPRHVELYNKHLPIIKNAARRYIDNYIESH